MNSSSESDSSYYGAQKGISVKASHFMMREYDSRQFLQIGLSFSVKFVPPPIVFQAIYLDGIGLT